MLKISENFTKCKKLINKLFGRKNIKKYFLNRMLFVKISLIKIIYQIIAYEYEFEIKKHIITIKSKSSF